MQPTRNPIFLGWLGFVSLLFNIEVLYMHTKLWAIIRPSVRDRVRTKMERDILADVNHPFVVKLHYGESAWRFIY